MIRTMIGTEQDHPHGKMLWTTSAPQHDSGADCYGEIENLPQRLYHAAAYPAAAVVVLLGTEPRRSTSRQRRHHARPQPRREKLGGSALQHHLDGFLRGVENC